MSSVSVFSACRQDSLLQIFFLQSIQNTHSTIFFSCPDVPIFFSLLQKSSLILVIYFGPMLRWVVAAVTCLQEIECFHTLWSWAFTLASLSWLWMSVCNIMIVVFWHTGVLALYLLSILYSYRAVLMPTTTHSQWRAWYSNRHQHKHILYMSTTNPVLSEPGDEGFSDWRAWLEWAMP